MSSKYSRMQSLIALYRQKTGEKEIDMHDVARWALANGHKPPVPKSPVDLLAKEFSEAARQETRQDAETGRPYRANHAVTTVQGDRRFTVWVDIDEAPRRHMQKSLIQRREQIISDNVQLSFDAEHWNLRNPNEEPIVIPLDYTPDVEWRINAPDEDEKAG